MSAHHAPALKDPDIITVLSAASTEVHIHLSSGVDKKGAQTLSKAFEYISQIRHPAWKQEALKHFAELYNEHRDALRLNGFDLG